MRGWMLIAVLMGAMVATAAWLAGAEPNAITRDNWGAQVGFAPEPNPPGFRPGLTIDKTNVDALAQLVPEAVRTLIKGYGLRLETVANKPYAPSNGYIAATNAHCGKARLIEIGNATEEREIEGYEGGLPFPQPKNGREVAWNYTLAYTGDDGENVFEVFWISAKRKVERTEVWKTTNLRGKFRTDIPPLPEVPSLVRQGVIFATLTAALRPLDKKGFASLYFGYFEPREPDGWIYIPSQRRATRLSFGTRGETWNSTDLLYEDVRGYTGSPEWMNWTLVQKATLLLPVRAGVSAAPGRAPRTVYDFDHPPYWNPRLKWELRPVYVVEATPKLTGYPYSKMVFYIDAESFAIYAKSAFDRRGVLWKVMLNASDESEDPTRLPPRIAASLVVDVQAEHATAFFWHEQKRNIGVDPGLFTLATLRRLGQ